MPNNDKPTKEFTFGEGTEWAIAHLRCYPCRSEKIEGKVNLRGGIKFDLDEARKDERERKTICGCGREMQIQAICNVCDNDE